MCAVRACVRTCCIKMLRWVQPGLGDGVPKVCKLHLARVTLAQVIVRMRVRVLQLVG